MRRLVTGRRCWPAFVVSLLALLMALTGVGYAATTGGLRLGRTNKTSKGTALQSKGGPTLKLTNKGGNTAASFNVSAGRSPFKVNSRAKVTGLNADLIDGLDSSAFQKLVGGSCAEGSAVRVINADGSVVCVSVLSRSWSLAGNGGTTPGTDFLGTTDAQPLVLKTNNTEALRIDTNGNLGIGTTTPQARVDASTATGTAVIGTSQAGAGVSGVSTSTDGVSGTSSDGPGVHGLSTAAQGVLGVSSTGSGLEGESISGVGVLANSPNGRGVSASSGSADGVFGTSTSADGVFGTSTAGVGVHGATSTTDAVEGVSTDGVGVVGVSITRAGVTGTSASGKGVIGVSSTRDGVAGTSTSGRGVSGESNTTDGVNGFSVSGNGVFGSSDNNGVVGSSSHASQGGTAAALLAINTNTGDIFIGEGNGSRVARINGIGKAFFNGGTQTGGADYAESMRASVDTKTLAPGDVLAIDPRRGNEVRLSDSPNSQLVAGVYSTKPSVLATGNHSIDDSLAGNVPVAMLGIVPTKVSAENGAVNPGDLLTTARAPGYAMKAKPVVVSGITLYPTGAILGKALQPLRQGRGVIEVLVTLR